MKVTEITVKLLVKTKEEESRILSLLALNGCVQDKGPDVGVKEEGPVADKAYTPSCERTKLAYEALGKCLRIRLARPELIEKWAVAFPDVNLVSFLHGLDSWAETNNVTRSPKGWARSCNFNLSREQDKVKKGAPSVPQAKTAPVVSEPAVDAWLEAAS